MSRERWLRVALVVGGLLALFWGFTLLFLPATGHDMMASGQPYDRATTQMFGGVMLATVIGAAMALRRPTGEYKELVHFMPIIWGIIFLVALYSLVVGDMDRTAAVWGSLVVDGLVVATLFALRP
ncbi:MAG: hypothetical protein ACE5IA_06440 [Dehalococcoidia bacterium]